MGLTGFTEGMTNALDNINVIHLPTSQAKPWHVDVSSDLRNHLVKKLITSIFPNPSNANIQEQAMMKLITFSKKVEAEMYEQADNKDHYYHKLAEKIYKIHKELDQRKEKKGQGHTSSSNNNNNKHSKDHGSKNSNKIHENNNNNTGNNEFMKP